MKLTKHNVLILLVPAYIFGKLARKQYISYLFAFLLSGIYLSILLSILITYDSKGASFQATLGIMILTNWILYGLFCKNESEDNLKIFSILTIVLLLSSSIIMKEISFYICSYFVSECPNIGGFTLYEYISLLLILIFIFLLFYSNFKIQKRKRQ